MSGIFFTADPATGKQLQVCEYVAGRLDKLVSGEVAGKRLEFPRPPAHLDATFDNKKWTKKLVILASQIERIFSYPQDIEWGEDSKTGRVFIFQSRDITTLGIGASQEGVVTQIARGDEVTIKGIPISGGRTRGRAKKAIGDLPSKEIADLLDAGDILLCHALRIDQLEALEKCAGIATIAGGLLSHAAIRAREMHKPYVGGILGLMRLVGDGQEITLDGDRGLLVAPRASSISDDEIGPTSEPPFHLRFNFFNPTRMKTTRWNNRVILYERISEGATDSHLDSSDMGVVLVYPDAIGDHDFRKGARAHLVRKLGLRPEQVYFDEHGIWDGDNSPSQIFNEFSTRRSLLRDSGMRPLVLRGERLCRAMDTKALNDFIMRIGGQASRLFSKGVKEFSAFIGSRDESHAWSSAKLVDGARKLMGDLVGSVLLDSAAMCQLEKLDLEISRQYRLTLEVILDIAAKRLQEFRGTPATFHALWSAAHGR